MAAVKTDEIEEEIISFWKLQDSLKIICTS